MVSFEYQSTKSIGYILGWVIALCLIAGAIAYTVIFGMGNNDRYKHYAHTFRFPVVVLIWRIMVSIFCLIALGFEFHEGDAFTLSYFTVWNWIMVCAYFIVATIVSVIKVFYPEISNGESDNSYVRALFSVHQWMGELEFPMSWFVAAVVWIYLAPNDGWVPFLSFTSVSMHACNAAIMTVDFFLSDYLINPQHFPITIFWGALYVCWHLIGNAAYGIMCYPFMKTDDPVFIAWLIGLCIACVLFFFLAYGLSVLKQRTMKCCNLRTFSCAEVDVEVVYEKSIDFSFDRIPPHKVIV